MEIRKRKCQQCGKETEDKYNYCGWIVIQANNCSNVVNICISQGRKENRTAKTLFTQHKTLDFCSIDCLVSFFRNLADTAKQEEVKEDERIFSGDYSRRLWNAINTAKSKEDLKNALFTVCCYLQKLESKLS